MALAEVSLDTIVAVFLTYEGRDKIARMFQFGSRAVVGLTAGVPSGACATVHDNARRLMVSITGSRRTFRWGREVPVVQALLKVLKSDCPIDRIIGVLREATLLAFFSIDHLGWFDQVRGGMKKGQTTIRLGLKFLTTSCVLAVLQSAKKLRDLCSSDKAEQQKSTERHGHLVSIVRNGLMAVQVAHLSRWWETHDALVGSLGIVTSLIDVMSVWFCKGKDRGWDSWSSWGDRGGERASTDWRRDSHRQEPERHALRTAVDAALPSMLANCVPLESPFGVVGREAAQGRPSKGLCRYFHERGHCFHGANCLYQHDAPGSANAPGGAAVSPGEAATSSAPFWLLPSSLANRATRPGEGPAPSEVCGDVQRDAARPRTFVRREYAPEERVRRDGLMRRLLKPEVNGYYSAILQCVRYIVATDFLRLERVPPPMRLRPSDASQTATSSTAAGSGSGGGGGTARNGAADADAEIMGAEGELDDPELVRELARVLV